VAARPCTQARQCLQASLRSWQGRERPSPAAQHGVAASPGGALIPYSTFIACLPWTRGPQHILTSLRSEQPWLEQPLVAQSHWSFYAPPSSLPQDALSLQVLASRPCAVPFSLAESSLPHGRIHGGCTVAPIRACVREERKEMLATPDPTSIDFLLLHLMCDPLCGKWSADRIAPRRR
jgi:hypothetical protein